MRLSRATVLPLVLVIGRRRGAGALDNYLGKHVRLAQSRGKAVFVRELQGAA